MIKDINNETYKPRNHPGILKPRVVNLPNDLIDAIRIVTEDYPLKKILGDSIALGHHLKNKRPPVEKTELRKTVKQVTDRVTNQLGHVEFNSEADRLKYQQRRNNKVTNILKNEVYNWKQVNYNDYNSLVYLIGRVAPEYAVLIKIFAEIATRDPEFRPRTLFDFGSGVGTVTW